MPLRKSALGLNGAVSYSISSFSTIIPMKRNYCPSLYRGFTLIELLVSVAVVAILASILFGVFGSVRQRANITQGTHSMRTIYQGIELYAVDHSDSLPGPVWFWQSGLVGGGQNGQLSKYLETYLTGNTNTDPKQVPLEGFVPNFKLEDKREDPAAKLYIANVGRNFIGSHGEKQPIWGYAGNKAEDGSFADSPLPRSRVYAQVAKPHDFFLLKTVPDKLSRTGSGVGDGSEYGYQVGMLYLDGSIQFEPLK
ncbi:MAG: type II secretion system protein [Verrucomicrobiota bacterium]